MALTRQRLLTLAYEDIETVRMVSGIHFTEDIDGSRSDHSSHQHIMCASEARH